MLAAGIRGCRGSGRALALDARPPCADLAMVLDEVCGPARSCPGASDDEVIGAVGRWRAVASWAEAGGLGTIREMIHRRALPGAGVSARGLPGAWEDGLNREVSLELGMISHRAADAMIGLAWALEARLPATAALLRDGVIDIYKARIIAEETSVLDDGQAGRAEAMIAGKAAGRMTAPRMGTARRARGASRG